ncbi:cysteine--tRNA ligase [Thermosulfuriphilus sp.]
MGLLIYNSLSRTKESFEPVNPPQVGMYVCGITAYDYAHIGHARSAVVFDVIYRYLKYRGYQVTYVRNFTDIDDKIINRANETGEPPLELAKRFIEAFREDMAALKVSPPSVEPLATEHIAEIIALISRLIEAGYAYEAGGDVYFAVESFPRYGALSHRSLEDMRAGARVAISEKKRHPLDFALWKAAKPGEPSWESPWGRGRPGWHIECSAMAMKYLGETIDIHGGGMDLIFPHHENEIAQSEAATGRTFVRYWIHNGFVTIKEEKMSKSLGNFVTIRDVLSQYHPEVIRIFLLSKHYRSPLDFSPEIMAEWQAALERAYETFRAVIDLKAVSDQSPERKQLRELGQIESFFADFENNLSQAMDDDFNTAKVVGLLFEGISHLNRVLTLAGRNPLREHERVARCGLSRLKKPISQILGILEEDPEAYLLSERKRLIEQLGLDQEEIEALVAEREAARRQRDFARADEIRDRLQQMGVVLQDTREGTKWKVQRPSYPA